MGREQMRQREDIAIQAFCSVIAVIDGQRAKVVDRPDRTPGETGGCEAIIDRCGRLWALEHTTFDSFTNQRLDDARLSSVLDPAMPTIAAAFPDFHITVSVPIGAVSTGTSWEALRDNFAKNVIHAIRELPPDQGHIVVRPHGLFEIIIHRRPGSGCYLYRAVSQAELAGRAEILARALQEKRAQLQPYTARGMPTVLLLDNNDLANMAPHEIARSFLDAARRADTEPFTDIFLVDATERPPWLYPLKLGDRLGPEQERKRFFEEQYRRTYHEP